MTIPAGHQAVMPYLMLEGAPGFIDFTASVFEAQLVFKRLREDQEIMHAEVAIGGSIVMFSEATPRWAKQTANLFVYVQDADETFARGIAAGATELMALSDQDYGRTCGITDPFGNVWWITTVR